MKKRLFFIALLTLALSGCENMNNSSNLTSSTSSSSSSTSSSTSSTSSSSSSSSISVDLTNYQLFEHNKGEDKTMEYFYNYCPTIFEEDGVRHIYYCANKKHGNVTDYVAYRKGVKDETGRFIYSDIQYVLEPTENSWDSRHVCDPSVVKGEFTYNQENYNYLMAYLGCVTSDNTSNEVGLAVSKSPEGPWIKVGDGPFCDYELNDNSGFQWGYGQPSLVSVDRKSEILLFYTVGDGKAHMKLLKDGI